MDWTGDTQTRTDGQTELDRQTDGHTKIDRQTELDKERHINVATDGQRQTKLTELDRQTERQIDGGTYRRI